MLDITWDAPGVFNIETIPVVEITGDPSTGEEEWLHGGHAVIEIDPNQVFGQFDQQLNSPSTSLFHYEINVVGSGPPYPITPFRLQQLNPAATSGAVPQTPMVSGEWFTGGPMCLVSKSSGVYQLYVEELIVNGSPQSMAQLAANNYVELYWFGNAYGYEIR